jgi:4-carboxymuconolactone decarboxylase
VLAQDEGEQTMKAAGGWMVAVLIATAFACTARAQDAGGVREAVPPRATTLPADIDPQSRSRLPLVKRENLNEVGRAAYDAVVDRNSRLRAELIGPAGIWLNIPELSPHIREVNWYLRNRISLDAKLAELAILVTARESDGQTEWTAHEPAGLRAGLDQRVVDIVKYRKPITDVPDKEAAIIKLGREVFRNKKVSSDTYAQAIRAFGQRGVIEIVMLMGTYAMTSVILHAFDQQLRPDLEPRLPVAAQ